MRLNKYMSIYKKRNKYWINISFNRRRYRMPSPDNSFAGAKAYESLIRQKLGRGESVREEKKEELTLFKDFVERWYTTYVLTNNKPSEQAQKKLIINKHLLPHFGNLSLDKISTLKIEEFKSKKQGQGLENKSINNLLGVIGKCLRTAYEWEIISKIPNIKPLKVNPKEVIYLNEKEYNYLLEVTQNEGIFYEMLLFTLRTGVRIGELLALEWTDINFNNKTVVIRRNIVNGIVGTPKNNKFRTIYLAEDIYSLLLRRREYKGLVFPDKTGSYQSRFACRNKLNRICAKAGIKKIGWHALRHSFASQLATNGVSLKTIQELLGHSDLKMVQRYAHLEPVTLKEAIQTLEPKVDFKLNFCHHTGTTS